MTEKETLKILSVCRDVGVQFNNADSDTLVEVWMQCFKNNTYAEVSKALFELIQSKDPLFVNGLIGRIKEKIIEKTVEFLDFSTAWELIRKAMHRTHPDIPQETIQAFNSLPPMLQHLVGSPRHLEDMEYCLDRDELETVERSNMKKMYTELVIKTKGQLALGQTPHWMPIEYKGNKKLEGAVKKLTEGHTFE